MTELYVQAQILDQRNLTVHMPGVTRQAENFATWPSKLWISLYFGRTIKSETRLFFGPLRTLTATVNRWIEDGILSRDLPVSIMASKSSDGWLWMSLGPYLLRHPKTRLTEVAILGYFGSLAVHRQLVAIRQASKITRHNKRPNISQQTEDGE